MSRVTRHKHIIKEITDTDNFETPKANQQIVRVISSKGNNLHEVEPPNDEEEFLASMPAKFRKNVWIKRGDFVLVEPIIEGGKVKGEIVKILTPLHMKVYSQKGAWPHKFQGELDIKPQEDVNKMDKYS